MFLSYLHTQGRGDQGYAQWHNTLSRGLKGKENLTATALEVLFSIMLHKEFTRHSTFTRRTIDDGIEKQVPGIELVTPTTVVWHLADWAILKPQKNLLY